MAFSTDPTGLDLPLSSIPLLTLFEYHSNPSLVSFTYPFEYIVIENFITGLDDKNIFDNYIKLQENLSQKEFKNDGPQHVSAYLDIIEKIRQKNKDIVEAINNVWDINCKYFYLHHCYFYRILL